MWRLVTAVFVLSLVVGVDARASALSAEPTIIELAEHPENVVVRLDLFGDRVYNIGEFPYWGFLHIPRQNATCGVIQC